MKQTEIGLIPDDWEVKRLGDSVDILRGGSPRPIENYLTTNADGINWIKIGDVKPNDKYIRKTEEKIIPEGKSRSREVKKGDFILSNSMSFGRPYILAIDGCIHDGWLTIQKYAETFDKEFLYYLLGSDEVFNQYVQMAAGSSVQNLNKDKVADLQLKIPPLPEQQRIAKALSDVDALISTTEKLIQKKKNIKQGAMQNLLTGKKRLPGFAKSTNYKQSELGLIPEDWEVKSLGDIFSIKHGYGFEGQFFSSENNQHIVVTPGNFKLEGGFQKQKQPIYYTGTYPDEFKLKPNDLIIMMTDLSKNSDTLGNPAIVPDDGNDYLHNQRIGLIQIHNDSFVKDYIYLLLCTKEYHEAVVATAAGSTVKHTSPKRIYSINLIVSTSKEEQSAIANVLSSMDKEIETLNTKLEKYRNLKTAMMQQLLTGKIRLIK